MKKMPPKEKIFEAWTAVADGRIVMHDGYATMPSSDGSKEYTIHFSGDKYASDDNASYWRGYPGYPVIAVMMLQGKLPYDSTEAEKWKGVNWKSVNTHFRNNYAEAVKSVAIERGIDLPVADAAAEEVMRKLEGMEVEVKRKL